MLAFPRSIPLFVALLAAATSSACSLGDTEGVGQPECAGDDDCAGPPENGGGDKIGGADAVSSTDDGTTFELGEPGVGSQMLAECASQLELSTLSLKAPPPRAQGAADYAIAAIDVGAIPAPHQMSARDFANRFAFEYPASGSVSMKAFVAPLDAEDPALARRFALHVAAIAPEVAIPRPVHVAVVADTSSSMEVVTGGDSPSMRQRAAIAALAEGLSDGDRLSLVSWDRPYAPFEYVEGSDDPADLAAAIDALLPRGEIGPRDAVLTGYELLRNGSPEALKHLVFISDGGVSLQADELELLASAASEDTAFHALGVGETKDYKTSALPGLAEQQRGTHRFAPSSALASSMFQGDAFARQFHLASDGVALRIATTTAVEVEDQDVATSADDGVAVRRTALGPGEVAVWHRELTLCAPAGALVSFSDALDDVSLSLVDASGTTIELVLNLASDAVWSPPVLRSEAAVALADAFASPSPERLAFTVDRLAALDKDGALADLIELAQRHPNFPNP